MSAGGSVSWTFVHRRPASRPAALTACGDTIAVGEKPGQITSRFCEESAAAAGFAAGVQVLQFVAYHTLMAHRIAGSGPALALVLATLALAWGCAAAPRRGQIPIGDIESGPGSLSATRKALEGTWTLDSLEVIDAAGVRRPVKSGGQLTYDDFGNMTIRGVVEDPALKGSLVLDYTGRITIDNVKHEFYPADLQSDRPVDVSQIGPISPDKIRRYELTDKTFVVTYIDKAAKPTAVIRWRR
jgi:hypothetical protein